MLDGLDADQRIIAEALHGPVCVLAGAGTGKTRAITHRIAYGVRTGTYDPAQVMALTFTSRAANELKGRLHGLGAGRVEARTFHSAALSQLNFFWPSVVGGSAPKVLDGKARMLAQAAASLKLSVDTPTLRDVAAEIEWRKVTGRSIEQYALAGRGPVGRLGVEQVADLQAAFERLKDERKQIDFEDVLLLTAGLLAQEPAAAMHVRDRYRHFVVDEYQDVSPLQQQLLELWLDDRRELCVVGDASQTIYSFAGADSAYLLDFERRWGDALVVRLERDYRSTPPIVEAANNLMRGRPGALRLRSAAVEADGGDPAAPGEAAIDGAPDAEPSEPRSARRIRRGAAAKAAPDPAFREYADEFAEARGVATAIHALIEDGLAPEDIAVLFRVNAQAVVIEQALAEAGVPARMRGSARFFDQQEVREAVRALRAAAIVPADEPLFKSVSDVLRSLGWTVEAPDGPGALRTRWESLNAIASLVDRAEPGTTFRQFADDLTARAAANHEPTLPSVTLATLHSAKGLEWEAVFLLGLSEGLLPITYADSEAEIDEERRLLYVGVTRARRRLELSRARRNLRSRQEPTPSRFLAELGIRTARGPRDAAR
nr:ATP-dependent helicase [Agromyces seonyuensis]